MEREKLAALREETIRNVRCCLVIVKGSMDIRQLATDYRTFMNAPIPYQKLGHESLEAFLRAVPALTVRRLSSGQVFVDAKPDPRSAHIGEMVARQKPAKKKAPSRPMYPQRPPHVQRWCWRPQNTVRTTPPRFTQTSHCDQRPQQQIQEYKQFVETSRIAAKEKLKENEINKENRTPPSNNNHSSLIMQHLKVKSSGLGFEPGSGPGQVQGQGVDDEKRLQAEGLAAVDSQDPLWNDWSSGSGESDGNDENDQNDKCEGDFVETGNITADLKNFAKFRRLSEPCVTVLERKTKSIRRVQYDCKIKIDGILYSSYPEDFHDKQSAIEFCSKLALRKLIEKYGRTWKSQPIATNTHILERIPPMVALHNNGVWSWQLETDYRALHAEVLPPGWIKIIAASPSVVVERFGQGDKFVLSVYKPRESDEVPACSACFDAKGFMTAVVTCAVSAGEIWCRQVGTAQASKFDAMLDHMNAYYQNQALQESPATAEVTAVTKVVIGRDYAAWEDTWHRVRVLEARGNAALCAFIDRGDDALVPLAKLKQLQRAYAQEPAQAFVCQLAGLEAVHEASRYADAIVALEGAEVTLKVMDASAQPEKVTVVMYDVDKNDRNKDVLVSIAMETAQHNFEADQTFEVHVSHIPDEITDDEALLWVQVHSTGYKALGALLERLEKELQHLPAVTFAGEGQMYFGRFPGDTKHHRVKIATFTSVTHAVVRYIDTGRTRVVNLAAPGVKLHPMEVLSLPLCEFPAQATLMRLHLPAHLKPIPKDLPAKMREMLPEGSLLLRVQHVDDQRRPNVMLFVPQPTGLVSVNDSLSLAKYKEQVSPGKASPPRSPLPKVDTPDILPSTGVLHAPQMPQPAKYFEVKIPVAVTPWNFFVQPLESARKLEHMMTKLQAALARNADALCLKDIVPGQIYAARRVDGAWCRVAVVKVIYPTAIVVFSVDYGYYASLSYQQLFPLAEEFLELPYQAIKAKLAGIKPVGGRWSEGDLHVFQKLVQGRQFVSVLMGSETDELYAGDRVLVLKLIDTTSQKDVVIGDMLVQKNIAVKDK